MVGAAAGVAAGVVDVDMAVVLRCWFVANVCPLNVLAYLLVATGGLKTTSTLMHRTSCTLMRRTMSGHY